VTKGARTDLIRYRLKRAREAFEEALLMKQEAHWNTCANRLYYACFYAVSALLAKEDLGSGKHSGVKALFNQHWVKTGKVSREFGRLYSQLFEARQEGDYVDFVSFREDAVAPWIPQVSDFVDTLSRLAEE
jgi:uncharacterized protein (UPF0332 family)